MFQEIVDGLIAPRNHYRDLSPVGVSLQVILEDKPGTSLRHKVAMGAGTNLTYTRENRLGAGTSVCILSDQPPGH